MQSNVSLNSNEIDVMFFLFDRPASSAKEVLGGVTLLSSFAAFDNVIGKLKRMSFVRVERDVLYSLSELGKVLIGKTQPNDYLKKDIERRGLTGVSFERETSYSWGSKLGEGDKGSNPAFSVLEKTINEELEVKGSSEEDAVEDKVDVVSKEWLFNEEEKQVLRGQNKNPSGLLSLQSRHIYVGEKRSVIGDKIFTETPRAPYNTDLFSLTRKQRIIIESMGHCRKGFIKLTDLRKILENCGESQDLDGDFKVLIDKGLIERKSNKVRYLTALAFIGFGYRRYQKGKHESVIKGSTNGKELLRRLELTIWTEHDFDNDLGLSKVKSENEIEQENNANSAPIEEKTKKSLPVNAPNKAPDEPDADTENLEGQDSLFEQSDSCPGGDIDFGQLSEQLSFSEEEDKSFSVNSERLNSALKDLAELKEKVEQGGKDIPVVKSASEKVALLNKLNDIFLMAGSNDARSVFSEIIEDYKKWDEFSKS